MNLKVFVPFLFLLSISQLSYAQKEFKALKGLVRFGEPMLYISATELSNQEYNAYLDWLKLHADSATFYQALPDTQAWSKYSVAYVEFYRNHSAYSDYPAVNVSQDQARKFCVWKAARWQERLKEEGSEIDSVIVRLPTEAEWKKAARIGLNPSSPFPWTEQGIRYERNKRNKGKILCNVTREPETNYGVASSLNQSGFITTPVMSYWPSPGGLWNMSGNVAEWINESGKTKGGSWNQGAWWARIDHPGAHDGDSSARPDIGFRYVLEVVSFKRKEEIPTFVMNSKFFYTSFVPLNDSIRMRDAEVSNYQYQQFLLEHKEAEYQIQDSLWLRYFPYAHITLYAHQDKYLQRPVVNISYEAAVAYCAWLTEKYNQWESRPDEQVIFRLPTRAEWEKAAYGGSPGVMYPWGEPYTRNSKGCYFANFRPLEDQYFRDDTSGTYAYIYPDSNYDLSLGADGSIIPHHVYSYFPNDYGFYHIAGNVAEMTADKGISRGGSWRSNQYEIRVDSLGQYTGPDPTVGFRVVMEIVKP